MEEAVRQQLDSVHARIDDLSNQISEIGSLVMYHDTKETEVKKKKKKKIETSNEHP